MTRSVPPRWRSLLFVPAHVPRFVEGAHKRGADGYVLDLEDAVPAAEKQGARDRLAESIATVSRGGAAMVRVNHSLRALVRDVEAAVVPELSALVLPKVEDAAYVREVADAVAELEGERGLAEGQVRLVLQVETPTAFQHLDAIARAHPRVAALTLGPEDYAAAIGAVPDPDTLLAPSFSVLCAARAAGILPLGFIDSIGAYGDLDAFRETVARARRHGFRGSLAVHPAQVAILNDGFAPTAAEVEWAMRVVAADEAARAAGRGAFELDGRMIDPPVVRRAADILANVSG